MKTPRDYASDVYTAVHKVQGQGAEYVELWHQAIAGVFAIAQTEAFKAGQEAMRALAAEEADSWSEEAYGCAVAIRALPTKEMVG